ISSTVAESADSKAEALKGDLDQLYQYARFPQGLPESWGGPRRAPPSVAAAPVVAPPLAPTATPIPVPSPAPSAVSSEPAPATTPPASASPEGAFPSAP